MSSPWRARDRLAHRRARRQHRRMIVARVIQGVGGGVLPLSFGIIRDEFPREKVAGRGRRRSRRWPRSAPASGWCSPGPIVDALDYHWLFWLPHGRHRRSPRSPRLSSCRSRRYAPTAASASCRPCCSPPGWSRCCSPSARAGWGWTSGRVIGLFAPPSCWRSPGCRRAASGVPADRHADDAAAGGVDHQPGRVAFRLRDVRVVRLPPPVQPDATTAGYGFGASITESGLILLPASVTMFLVGITRPGSCAGSAPSRWW